ncbi:MAG: hypothetical protein ACI4EG_15250 [Fusicatenibacter sp.]|nr:hypothetical protein [Fusicatenibacter sp.]
MKTLREQFEEDYAAVPYTRENSGKIVIRYVYDGPWYLWELPEKVLKKKKRFLVGLSIADFWLFVAVALLPTGVNTWSATAIAGSFSLAFQILELFGVICFWLCRYRTTRMSYQYVNRIMKTVPWLSGMALAAASLSGIVYQIRNSFGIRESAATLGYLICSVTAVKIAADYRKIPFRTEKNAAVTK